MSKRGDSRIADAMTQLDAEAVLMQTKARHELLKACIQLMPKAVSMAKGRPARPARGDKPAVPAKPGSPALLRLISRIVLRPIAVKAPAD